MVRPRARGLAPRQDARAQRLQVGAAVAARIAPRVRRPVLVYAVLELVIAVSALALPVGLDAVNWLYAGLFGGAPAPPPWRVRARRPTRGSERAC